MDDVYSEDFRKLRICSFDLETTGTNAKDGNIVEFGAIIWQDGKIVDSVCKLVKPKRKIEKKAEAVHGISMAMVKDEPEFAEQAESFRDTLESCDIWCAFNDSFDRSFMKEEFKRAKVKCKTRPTIDPLIWARGHWSAMKNNLGVVSQRLGIVLDKKEKSYLSADAARHRADYDALVTIKCLWAFANVMPRSVRQVLYVQDYMYRYWINAVMGGNKKYIRKLDPTMPPEHVPD